MVKRDKRKGKIHQSDMKIVNISLPTFGVKSNRDKRINEHQYNDSWGL